MKYLFIVFWLLYLLIRLKKSLHMLQQTTYNKGHEYLKWTIKNFISVFIKYDILQLSVFVLALKYSNNWFYLINVIVYLFLIIYNLKQDKKISIKKPLVYTSRAKRLILTSVVLYSFVIWLSIYFKMNIFLILICYFQFYLLIIVNIINIPIEKLVYLSYKNKALKKLKDMPNLKVIGITGSYGKTSCKNILSEILKIKYNTLPTPENYNTPNGLLLSINNYLGKFDEVFIAEMGARSKGEIKELCDLVHPEYGILTKIGTAHLETFKTEEVIQKTKFELIESLPRSGIGIMNADDTKQMNYNFKSEAKIITIGINNKSADILAEDISSKGGITTFTLKIKGEKEKHLFETKLLGKANIYNILSAIALGLNFGITIPELVRAVKRVKPVPHRLELKQMVGFYLIDDAYNSNPEGAKMALEVLSSMPGKKIIITPGMIELGSVQDKENEIFGEEIAKVCDEVILIGKKQTLSIRKGLQNKKFDDRHIYNLDSINDAFSMLLKLIDKETYVLIENDLPDSYN